MMDVTSCYGDMFLFTQDPWAQNHQNLTLPPKVGIFSISSFLLGDGGLRYIYIYHQHISCPHEMVNFNMNLYLNYSELALVGA